MRYWNVGQWSKRMRVPHVQNAHIPHVGQSGEQHERERNSKKSFDLEGYLNPGSKVSMERNSKSNLLCILRSFNLGPDDVGSSLRHLSGYPYHYPLNFLPKKRWEHASSYVLE